MTTSDDRLADLAARRLGAFSREDAHRAGLTDNQLRTRVRSGRLVQTGPHGFRFPGAALGLHAELNDVIVDVGPPVWAFGPTAAALLGFDEMQLRRPFELVVPRHRSINRWNVRVHRTDSIALIDQARVGPFPVTSAARTLIDLSRTATTADLTKWLDGALRDGLVSEDLLHRRVVALRARGRYGLPRLHEVLAGHEVTRGGHSWLEREYLRLLADAALPKPETQAVLTRAGDRLVRVDCRFTGTPVVVELLGYQWHRSRSQMARDAQRLNALVAAGFAPYQFTYGQVVGEPEWVIAETRTALARHPRAA